MLALILPVAQERFLLDKLDLDSRAMNIMNTFWDLSLSSRQSWFTFDI